MKSKRDDKVKKDREAEGYTAREKIIFTCKKMTTKSLQLRSKGTFYLLIGTKENKALGLCSALCCWPRVSVAAVQPCHVAYGQKT